MTHSVLLVGSAALAHPAIADTLRSLGYRTVELDDIDLAPGALNAVKTDVLILDLAFPADKVARVAAQAKQQQTGLRIIVVGRGDLDAVSGRSFDAVIHADFFMQGIHGLIRELCDT